MCYPEGDPRLVAPRAIGTYLRMSLVAVEPTDRITNQVRWTVRFELPAGAPAPARIGVQTLISAGERSQLHILGYEVVEPTRHSVLDSEVVEVAPCSALTLVIRTAGPLFDGTYPYTLRVWKVGLPEGSTTGTLSLHLSCSDRTFSCAKVDAAATPAPTATPVPGVLDPNFGVVYWGVRTGFEKGSAPQVRREGETTAAGELAPSYFNQFNGSVSPDGRRAAYFAQGQSDGAWGLYLLDGARPNEQRRLLSIPGEVPYGRPVWSGDGGGVAFTVADHGAVQGVRPKLAALRTLDLATGAVSESARVAGGDSYSVLGWDRAGGTLAYVQQGHGEPAKTYVAHTAAGARTWTIDRHQAMFVSPDAREVLGVDCAAASGCTAATWKLGDFAAKSQRRLEGGLRVSVIGWRPGTNELVLVVGGMDVTSAMRVAVWSLDTGVTRDVHHFGARMPNAIFLRADGAAVIVELALNEVLVIDLATGKASPLPLPIPREPYEVGRAAASIRLR
jgi:hypothetical protein